MSGDLEILLPDVELTLAGEPVTVREYRFVQGLQVQALAQPLLDQLADLFLPAIGQQTHDISLEQLADIWSGYPRVLTQLLAMSVERPPGWVEALSDEDGQTLLLTWWRVNRGFFVRRLTTALVGRRGKEPSTGERSSAG